MARTQNERSARRVLALALIGAALMPAGRAAAQTARILEVVSSGLTPAEATSLATAFEVTGSRAADGSFKFISPRFGEVPTLKLPVVPDALNRLRPDEDGRAVVAEALNPLAILLLDPIDETAARQHAAAGLAAAGLAPLGDHSIDVVHGEITLALDPSVVPNDVAGLAAVSLRTPVITRRLDTTVRYSFTFNGAPIEGPGQRLRITYAPDGTVTEVRYIARRYQPGAEVTLMSDDDARLACSRTAPAGSQVTASLAYWAPQLSEPVARLYPHWRCGGTTSGGHALVERYVPAVHGVAPTVVATAFVGDDGLVHGSTTIRGGTPPFRYRWGSMNATIDATDGSGPEVSYLPRPRALSLAYDTLIVGVVDANGLAGYDEVIIPDPPFDLPPLPSPAALAVGSSWNEWKEACVRSSAASFDAEFAAHGVDVAFQHSGENSWERDFRQAGPPTNGSDDVWTDRVDLAWYTGHGHPLVFAFTDNNKHDDETITAGEARFDQDLEWLVLWSCLVMQAEFNGQAVQDRWGPLFAGGLHVMNGFETKVSCPFFSGGWFAGYLFQGRTIRDAWVQTAIDLVAGNVTVSMGPIRLSDWASNVNDHFWNQGEVGPDIAPDERLGFWVTRTQT